MIINLSILRLNLVRVDKEDLDDPEDRVIKGSGKKRESIKFCSYDIEKQSDIDYALFLIKQVYDKFYER